jgi:hypothetical protein
VHGKEFLEQLKIVLGVSGGGGILDVVELRDQEAHEEEERRIWQLSRLNGAHNEANGIGNGLPDLLLWANEAFLDENAGDSSLSIVASRCFFVEPGENGRLRGQAAHPNTQALVHNFGVLDLQVFSVDKVNDHPQELLLEGLKALG